MPILDRTTGTRLGKEETASALAIMLVLPQITVQSSQRYLADGITVHLELLSSHLSVLSGQPRGEDGTRPPLFALTARTPQSQSLISGSTQHDSCIHVLFIHQGRCTKKYIQLSFVYHLSQQFRTGERRILFNQGDQTLYLHILLPCASGRCGEERCARLSSRERYTKCHCSSARLRIQPRAPIIILRVSRWRHCRVFATPDLLRRESCRLGKARSLCLRRPSN